MQTRLLQYDFLIEYCYLNFHDFVINFNTIDTGIVSLNQSPSILQYDQQCNYAVCLFTSL